MARQKQTKPLQRAISSELVHLLPEERDQNGSTQKPIANGSAKGAAREISETSGVLQLVICVLGIYASLYDLPVDALLS